MTQRERQTPDRGNGPLAVPNPTRTAYSDGRNGSSLWESLYLAAPLARRQELLAKARATGVLYTHELAEGSAVAAPAPRPLSAAALLNGRSRELAPVRSTTVSTEDVQLDADQREAVARAMHTPDICLIAGVAGSGKTRVVGEILCQAVSRGQRVVFLAPGNAALDHVLSALADRESLCPVRCLAGEETPEQLPAKIRTLTLDARVRFFREHTLPRAREAARTARSRLEHLRHEESIRQRIDQLTGSRASIAAQLAVLETKQSALFDEVMAATGDSASIDSPFGAGLVAAQSQRNEALARLDGRESTIQFEQEKIRAELNAIQTDLAKLAPSNFARIGVRLWNMVPWRVRSREASQAQIEALSVRCGELETSLEHRSEEVALVARERLATETVYQSAVADLVNVEVARRVAVLEQERAALVAADSRITQEITELSASLNISVSPETNGQASASQVSLLVQAEEAVAAAEGWAAAVERALPNVARELFASADIVAATMGAIAENPLFSDSLPPFDLLVLDEAERITETEFQRASRLARRWVLVGESTAENANRGADKTLRPSALRPGFFHRLWDNLHADPGRLPYSWRRLRDGRLWCQLRPTAPDDRGRMETEYVEDQPDVELRILNPPRGTPEIVEVVFPANMPAADAKAFLRNELDVLPIQCSGRSLRWSEEPGRLVLHLSQHDSNHLEKVSVAPGVAEWIGPASPGADSAPFLTYAIAFEGAESWSRQSAEEWLARHTQLHDPGRTCYLGIPHRMRPSLARFVMELVGGASLSDVRPDQSSGGRDEPPVEFIPVPSLPSDADNRRRPDGPGHRRGGGTALAPRLRSIKGGAGLETELSEARRPDVLPGEFRDVLPAQGLVNFLEARTVVHSLEALATHPEFRDQAERWHRTESGRLGRESAIFVIALYPAQAELIRQLMARVPALSATTFAIEVGTPEQFQHRECLAALVSLTRSHQHRPVSYGDGPQALALACTRARARLLLFGDPGSLVRRSQCLDPVDHLDPSAAAREHALVSHLVACIQGNRPICLRQGPGV